jgi:hypothetical protein
MEVVGKYTCVSVPPASYITCPNGISTNSSFGNQRCRSGVRKLSQQVILRRGRSSTIH